MRKTLNKKNIIKFLTFKEKIDNDVNEMSNNILQWERRFDINIIYRLMILNVMNEITIVDFIQIDIKQKDKKIGFQFEMWRYIENIDMNVFEINSEIEYVFILIEIQLEQLTI